ncbi:MAG: hypothetical protein L0H70_10105, partial [Xanthomonadales bacterium]|nr:hypothetical protein [Xanthomonadales bacterium]
TLDPVQDQLDIEATLPAMFYGTSNPLNSGNVTGNWSLSGGAAIATRSRKRVLVLETLYKQSANTPLILGDDAGDLNGQRFDRHNSEHEALLGLGTVSLVDSVTESMQYALWTPGLLLRAGPTPYKHQKFPFTPSWGYRAHRDGMPYGPIRPARDAQDEYNKRRSKILYDLATNRVVYESDAMDEADENRNLDEAKRPDGEIRLSPGGMEKFKIDRALDALQGQIAMLSEAKQNIYESSGVTRENTGTSTGDQSGRAILAKQQQGATTTAELFDNYRQAIQESGQKTLSNCEKFLTLPKLVRIAGDGGAVDFLAINTPQLNPETGEVMWDNDITASEADFVVDQSDYRETVRMAMAEMLFELIGKMPGEAGIQLLDIAVDMTDLPNKAALAARIRTMNHQPAPGQEQSPEQQAQAQSSAQAQQAAAQLAQAGQVASVRLTNAQAAKNEAEAKKVAVTGKTDALNAAGMLAAALPLAPAADRLWDPTEAAQILAPPPNQ